MKIEEAIEIIKKHHPFATKYQTDEECIALQTLISYAQKPKVTSEEIEKLLKEFLWEKVEIFRECAKDCERHNCSSGMGHLLSITSEHLATELEKLINGEGR